MLKDKKFILIIAMGISIFFMLGFVAMKLLLKPKKLEIPINVEQVKTAPPLSSNIPVSQETQQNNGTSLQQPIQQNTTVPVQSDIQKEQNLHLPTKDKKNKIDEISKRNDVQENSSSRDVFKEFYISKKAKEKEETLKIKQNLNNTITPPPVLPPFNTNVLQPQSQPSSPKLVDIKIYGFYTKDNEIFVITNVGILNRNSKIDQNETVIDITKTKIITNLREIYF